MWRVVRPTSSSPLSLADPVTECCRPRIAWVSSVWPLPWTPAMQTTSPLRTSRSTLSTTAWPVSERTVRPRTSRTTSFGAAAALSTFRLTARPTIMVASSVSESVGSAEPTTLPRRMTVIRSATALISRSLWLIITTERPLALSWRMISSSSSVSCGVSTAVGSSRMRIWASLTRALMISTRCCTPTGRSSTRASGSTSRLYFCDSSSTWLRAPSMSRNAPLVSSWPSITFSATVKTGTSMKCWWTMPIPASIASPGSWKWTSWPSMRIVPSSGR